MTLDGLDARAVAARIGAPRVELRESVASTMDEAHRLAEAGAPSGAVVIADRQVAGRGRFGRRWTSEPGAGLWMTTLHRGVPAEALDVLSIRIGLALGAQLDAFAGSSVQIKWPNDLVVAAGKLGGILVEARWRDTTPEWVAIGVGVNLVRPLSEPAAAGLRAGTRRVDLLAAIFPAMLEACRATGDLTPAELRDFASRDAARDADVVSPARGVARGVSPKGALIVDTEAGRELFRRGSLVRAQEAG